MPSGSPGVPCGYLLFSPPYQKVAREAAARGWPIHEEPGGHLHQIVDPGGVTAAILGLLRAME